MKGDIAVAGFMLTAEEWNEFDAPQRAQLVAVITRREGPRMARGSGPVAIERDGSAGPRSAAERRGELIEPAPSPETVVPPPPIEAIDHEASAPYVSFDMSDAQRDVATILDADVPPPRESVVTADTIPGKAPLEIAVAPATPGDDDFF